VEPSSAVFPPVAGSRLPTSVSSRPATSLVTRFKMKKRLSDQWEQVFGAYQRVHALWMFLLKVV
jgi:hypothetical protein